MKKVCTRPIPLTSSTFRDKASKGTLMENMMVLQEDRACPFKMIDDQLYDFRCFICKKLPRAGMANRSELYRHYSLYHYHKEILEEFGKLSKCPQPGCNKIFTGSGKNAADHMGQVHDEVDKYIPQENRIPKKKPKPKVINWNYPFSLEDTLHLCGHE